MAAPTTTSAAAWQRLGVHMITLPSGAVVKIRLPDLAILLAGEAVPQELRDVAFEEIRTAISAEAGTQQQPQQLDAERLRRVADLNRFLVSEMLVEPKMSRAQVAEATLPAEDLEMLAEIAGRECQHDARGVQIGVEPIDRWELWRHAHACPEPCEHCAEVLSAFSSVG